MAFVCQLGGLRSACCAIGLQEGMVHQESEGLMAPLSYAAPSHSVCAIWISLNESFWSFWLSLCSVNLFVLG